MIRQLSFAVTVFAITSTAALAPHAVAKEDVDAQALVQENCTRCHGTEVYTRSDRRVNSFDALHGQVRMCEQNLGLTWFDDQVDAVAGLLNEKYYNFER